MCPVQFLQEFVRDGRKCGLYCLSLLLSNMFILKSFPSSWFLYHLFSNINNAGMGIAGMLVILPLLKTWDNNVIRDSERGAIREVIFLAAMIMLTTGIKGPAAMVVVGGMTGTIILGLILKAGPENHTGSHHSRSIIYVHIRLRSRVKRDRVIRRQRRREPAQPMGSYGYFLL